MEAAIDAGIAKTTSCVSVLLKHREGEGRRVQPNANLSSCSLSVLMVLLCLWVVSRKLAFSESVSSRE